MRLKNSSVSGDRAAPPERNAQNFQPKRRWIRRKIQARLRNFPPFAFSSVLFSHCNLPWPSNSLSIPACRRSSMRGTAISAVARSCLMVRMISAGLLDGSNTTAAPSSGGTNNARNWPKTWLNGTRVTKRNGWNQCSYFRYSSMPRSSGSRFARKLPCVRTTPRGSAVVPEV